MKQTRYMILGGMPILLGVVLFLVVNLLYQREIEESARQGLWFDSYDSKIAFMKAAGQHDVIFLGSSRTQNHINTELVRRLGMDAFNMGLPSRELFDQYDSVREAVKVARKYVVISIPVTHLFSPNVRFPNQPTLCSFSWFTLHYPGSFNADRVLKLFPLNRNKGILETYNWGKAHHPYLEEKLKRLFDYAPEDDPRAINYIRERNNAALPPKVVVVYQNGDGSVFSRSVAPGMPRVVRDFTGERVPEAVAEYINTLAAIAREHSVTLVLNLIAHKPALYCEVDLDAVRTALPGCVVLDSQPDIPSEQWADGAHLGHDAANAYTETLVSLLQGLPDMR